MSRIEHSWLRGWMLVSTALGLAGAAHAQSASAPYLTAYRYTTGGLLTGKISPAPSGSSNFLATRNTYDANGRLWIVETGVLASITAPPPVAITCGPCSSSRAITRASPARKYASPCCAKSASWCRLAGIESASPPT